MHTDVTSSGTQSVAVVVLLSLVTNEIKLSPVPERNPRRHAFRRQPEAGQF